MYISSRVLGFGEIEQRELPGGIPAFFTLLVAA
jgi:hypothetical protein